MSINFDRLGTKHSLHAVPFETILETKNISDALDYLKKRQSTIRCIELIEMIEGVLAEEK